MPLPFALSCGAVYLLYAGARICSIMRLAKEEDGVDVDALIAAGAEVHLVHDAELAVGKAILRFQEVVELSLTTLNPSAICEYLYNLCDTVSKFYNTKECRVRGTPETGARLLLLKALEKVLRQAYALIGIGFMEKL